MFSGRNGQANQAGTLVIIIALLLVLYVLLLPPDSKQALLEDPVATPPNSPDSKLLSYVPSTTVDQGVQVRPLPVFTLRTAIEGNVLAQRADLSVSRSVFDLSSETIAFSSPPNARNVLLSFSVDQAKGTLELLLNGQSVYSSEIQRRQPDPIPLPANLLQSQNELEFRVSSVGFSFWDTNRYSLSDVRITADVAQFERASQTQRFVVQDASSVQSAALEFVPDCFEAGGRMEIIHNENLIYSGFPTCGIPLVVDLAPSQLREAENFLVFSIVEGEYIIDQAELVLVREPEGSKGEFSLSQQQYTDLMSRNAQVMLSLSFASPQARGTVVVNGQPLTFRTSQQSFANAITPYIRQGTNTVVLDSSDNPVTLIEVYEE